MDVDLILMIWIVLQALYLVLSYSAWFWHVEG